MGSRRNQAWRRHGGIGLVCALLLAGLPLPACADAIDINRCSKLANRYGVNPFALTMADLDALRLCVSWQMTAIQHEAEDRRIDRAIQRNFGTAQDEAERAGEARP